MLYKTKERAGNGSTGDFQPTENVNSTRGATWQVELTT